MEIIKEEFDDVTAGMKFKHGLTPDSIATIDAGENFDPNTGAPLSLEGSYRCFKNRKCYNEFMRGFDSPGQYYDALEPIIQAYREGQFIEEKYYHITDATYDDGTVAEDIEFWDDVLEEAEYQGRKVTLNKPMKGDVKKSKVYVKNAKGNVVKVNFGDKKMRIKKSNPKRRKSFRARHNCKNPGPKWKARYWSCKAW